MLLPAISMRCKICGQDNCDRHGFFLGKARRIQEFSGSSPPEIFVGRWNYPNVYTGILSPEEYGNTTAFSAPESWHSNKLSIREILALRNKLIYGRTQSHIKHPSPSSKFISVMQEVAQTSRPIAAEFKLKKPITRQEEQASNAPLISRAADIASVRLQENPKIEKKVDYLVNDTDVKSRDAMLELEKSSISTSSIIKLLSAGLLGMRKNRKI